MNDINYLRNSSKVCGSPQKLTAITADLITRCLIYEDYDECCFYRWDPVKIWQFEIPQPKKKGKKKNDDAILQSDLHLRGHPLPPWYDLKKFRDWWWNNTYLGPINSVLRNYIISALEQRSWTSSSEEEDVLFMLLRLCLDTQINIGSDTTKEIPLAWTNELVSIIEKLAPFPVQKLTVTKDVFGNKDVIAAIVQGCPKLQIFRIGQWELSNDILLTLGRNCKQLVQFSIPSMKPDVFMSDIAFFQCFFNGLDPIQVMEQYTNGELIKLSFPNLKYIDLLYCKHMQRFLQMICLLYPEVSLSGIDCSGEEDCEQILYPFSEIGSSINSMAMTARTRTILDDKLISLVKKAPYLRELRLHIDDNFPGSDIESMYRKQLEKAAIKLKVLFSNIKCIDTLVLRPHEDADISKVLLPSIAEYGKNLRSLQLLYDFSSINTNIIYQMLNQCPQLEKLIVSFYYEDGDAASKSFRTQLQKCIYLDTFILIDLGLKDDLQDFNETPVLHKIASDVIKVAPNLQVLSICCSETFYDQFLNLNCPSVTKLHLQFLDLGACGDNCDANTSSATSFLTEFLAGFPNVKVIYLNDYHCRIWFECLETLTKVGYRFTRKTPEFFNYYKWVDHGHSNMDFSMNFVAM